VDTSPAPRNPFNYSTTTFGKDTMTPSPSYPRSMGVTNSGSSRQRAYSPPTTYGPPPDLPRSRT
jgi:hypothetical protein